MPYPTGDINQDGVVNSIDLSLLVSRWNTNDADADLNSDGTVDSLDLSTLVGNWGATGSGDNPLLVARESCIIFDPAYVSDTTQALDLQQDITTPLNNGVTYTTDPDFGNMSQWPGSGNEVVPIPGTATEWNSKIGSEITLVALARWDGSNNVGARLISQGTGTGPGEQQYELGVRSGGPYGLRSRINVNGTRLEVVGWPASGEIAQDEAFVAAVTYDGSTSSLYVARSSTNWSIELVGGTNGAGAIDSGSTSPVIGNITEGWNNTDNVWSGQIGMAGIWSRALSQQELQEIANSPIESMSAGYEPPPAPNILTGLSVSSFTHNSASLTWNAVTDATSYEIEVISGNTYTNISSTSYTVTGLSAQTSYSIRARAVNISGAGPWSDAVMVTTTEAPAGDETAMMSSIDSGNDGIGWGFDGEYAVGQYCNGDYFVVGPVTITDIQPGSFDVSGRIQHGSQLNPTSSGAQGFDNEPRDANYDSSLNVGFEVSNSNPLALQPGDSLVTSRTKDTGTRPFVRSIAVLTVVDSAPAAGEFRPPYVGPKTTWPTWNESDLDYTKLPKLAPVSGAPTPAAIAGGYRWPWYDPAVDAFKGRDFRPDNNMEPYGREIIRDVNTGALTLCLDYSDAAKRDLLVNMVQIGIDNYGVTYAGGGDFFPGVTVEGGWFHNGGHAQGRKLPIMLAGLVLNDATLTNRAADTNIWFQEDDQTLYVDQGIVDRTEFEYLDPNWSFYDANVAADYSDGYTQAMLGMPEWGIRARAEENKLNPWRGARYRESGGGNANNYGGYTLAARLLGLKDAWNHDALFDYADRHHGLLTGTDWPDLGGVTQVGEANEFMEDYHRQMWNTYRSTVG